MKIFLNILIGLAIIVAILAVAALFIKKDYSVSREITINKPKQEVFDYLKMLKNQKQYNKWWTMDPSTKMDFKGTDGTPGFTAYWDSEAKGVGKGEQEIKKITDGQRIDYEIRFIKPFENTAVSYITTDSIGPGKTKVIWVFEGKNKYPMNLMNLFMDKFLGGDLQTSIANLKNTVEK
jgi:hypothetical protein